MRPYSERFCDVPRKSKFTLTCDVVKSFRIGPKGDMLMIAWFCPKSLKQSMTVKSLFVAKS